MDFTNQNHKCQFRLSSGRLLGYAEYGDTTGALVFYFHGWPSSRLEAGLLDAHCRAMRLRLLAPDRPGYGLSDFQPGRTLLSWPRDVCELADHLGATRFSLLGVSGGGPYAIACGASIPHRVAALLLVGSVSPSDSAESIQGMVGLNRWLLTFARRAPWLAERFGAILLRALWGQGDQPIPASVERRLPPPDQRALQSKDLREILISSSREALRHGTRGAAQDGLLLARPWGFTLDQVRLPVRLWHGERDVVVPPAMGRCLAQSLPNCHATFYPEDGHFSLPYNRGREILACTVGNTAG